MRDTDDLCIFVLFSELGKCELAIAYKVLTNEPLDDDNSNFKHLDLQEHCMRKYNIISYQLMCSTRVCESLGSLYVSTLTIVLCAEKRYLH